MSIKSFHHAAATDHTAILTSRMSNRVAARRRSVASTYPAPSVVLLKPGRLAKLAWIFGLR